MYWKKSEKPIELAYLGVAETWPAVSTTLDTEQGENNCGERKEKSRDAKNCPTFSISKFKTHLNEKVLHSSPFGGCKKMLSSIAVIKVDFTRCSVGVFNKFRLFEVSAVLCVMPVSRNKRIKKKDKSGEGAFSG